MPVPSYGKRGWSIEFFGVTWPPRGQPFELYTGWPRSAPDTEKEAAPPPSPHQRSGGTPAPTPGPGEDLSGPGGSEGTAFFTTPWGVSC